MPKWTIKIENLGIGGLSPSYWKSNYPTYGNNNMLVSTINVDLTNPELITQGPGLSSLTGGTQAGNVSTLIKGLLGEIESSDSIYGVGGAILYPISSSAVSSGHTIAHPSKTGEDGEDVAKYSGELFYSYNHNTGGDIGKFDLSSTYDDDWWCYSSDTEVLTKDGWKRIIDVEKSETIYSYNKEKGIVEEAENTLTYIEDHKGEMIHFIGEGIDLLTTPNHRMLAAMSKGANQYDDFKIVEAKDLIGKHFRLKKGAKWQGKEKEKWSIPLASGTKTIPTKLFMRFLGYYISEGHCGEYCVVISQQESSKYRKEIEEVVEEIANLLSLNVGINKKGVIIYGKSFRDHIKGLVDGNVLEKDIPKEVLSLSPDLLLPLYEGLMVGDGDAYGHYYTSSGQLKEDLIFLVNKLGWSARVNISYDVGDKKVIEGRQVVAKAPAYSILINKKKNEPRFNHHKEWGATVRREKYKGKIVCLSLDKNHIMLVRRNGLSVWSGNTATAGGSELTDNPHQMAVGGTDGILWIADGQYVKQWDGTTATDDAFNTDDSDSIIQSLVWNQDRVHIAANKPNVTGTNKNIASIYIWDGYSSNWEARIEIKGRVGALYVKDGITYVWYQKNLSDDVVTLGYVTGTQVKDLANYEGDLPSYYQVTEYKGFLTWLSDDDIFAFGSGDVSSNARIFQLASAGHSTGGGITNAFGTPIVASHDGSTNYRVAEFSGYDTTSSFKTMTFDVAEWSRKASISEIHLNLEPMSTGAEVDITIKDNGGNSLYTSTVSYANDGAKSHKKISVGGVHTDNFRLEFDFSDGSTSNPVKIKDIYIRGNPVI